MNLLPTSRKLDRHHHPETIAFCVKKASSWPRPSRVVASFVPTTTLARRSTDWRQSSPATTCLAWKCARRTETKTGMTSACRWDVRGARVRARREFRFTSEPETDDSVDARLERMFRSPVATTELPLRVATYAYPNADRVRVVIAAEVDAAGDGPPALTLRYMLHDPEGTVAGSSESQQVTPTLTQTANGPVLQFISSIRVEPGAYTLKLAVIDAAGWAGSVEHSVDAEWMLSGPLWSAT